MKSNISFYEKRIDNKNKELKEIDNKCNFFSILRLVIAVLAIITTYFLYKNKSYKFILMEIIAFIIAFTFIAYIHSKTVEYKKMLKININVNEDALSRVNGKWKEFLDKGEEYLNVEHPFINDLDIFGKGSLFQWINTTTTLFGRKSLKEKLSIIKLPKKEEIYANQKMLKELGEKINFRQDIESLGRVYNKEKGDIDTFLKWAKERNDSILNIPTLIISIIMPILTVGSIILFYPLNKISTVMPSLFIILNIIIIKFLVKDRSNTISVMYDLRYKIKTYFRIIKRINEEDFQNEDLNMLKGRLTNKNKKSAAEALRLLDRLEGKVSDTGNMFYLIMNFLFLWDIHLLREFEKWRRENGGNIEEWFFVLGEIEALSSIANLNFDNKDWSYPSINDELKLSAINIGHPFLGDKMITNDLLMEKNKNIILITGSNMSGKSTFLRTIGINMILTYLGAPACAKEFSCPILNIYTCMRIGDNLEENISSFYAEILRVKNLIEATKREEKVFFLLDEIFKGTNSIDRHTGAEILINQLCEKDAMGFVSTHDLELCDLEEKNQKVLNYHFEEYYVNNEIKFDYKLKRGKSNTRNAVYLMRMAGIDI
ncbi:MutS family DNA mismatch repair protein [Clostridium fallax]|uniref:MutS domain V n=1 Tax=Clostridium fallax TaxID=1533 RepID=A0A1M4VCQ3_9CLOT|nr:MutS family DNA mismatch repair protein [Clostridium fallax]SHE66705.1 MutS domain V [Clostridium fallax]SQB05781.1 MutS domain-containing protein [Clostridium fallax]